jgi:hypothetical protein
VRHLIDDVVLRQRGRRGAAMRATADLWAAAAVMAAGVLGCAAVRFDTTTMTDGLSWFGVHQQTLLPYAAALLTAVALQWHASTVLPISGDAGRLRAFLRLSAALMLGILLTPYAVNGWFNAAHEVFGTCLFALQLAFGASVWLRRRGVVIGVLLLVQFTAGLAAAAALMRPNADLFVPQVVYQAAFWAYLPRGVPVT